MFLQLHIFTRGVHFAGQVELGLFATLEDWSRDSNLGAFRLHPKKHQKHGQCHFGFGALEMPLSSSGGV